MSTIVMSAVWPLQGMSPAQKSVLVSLADQANDDGVCWPGVGTIAARTCLSPRAVQDALAWLETVGLLRRNFRHNTSTSYQLTLNNFNPAKAPAARGRRSRGAPSAPDANGAPPAVAAPPADGAPPATSAPGADGAPPPADGAPGGADGAPPGVQMAHPNRKKNHQGTVNEPLRRQQPPPAGSDESDLQAACKATWQAYSQAYAARHGVQPVRNAKVNGQVRQLVTRLGHDESPGVAAFYVGSNDPLIVRSFHDLGTLLVRAEAFRTQWATGHRGSAAPTAKFDPVAYMNNLDREVANDEARTIDV